MDFKNTPEALKARGDILTKLTSVNSAIEKLISKNLENHDDLLNWFNFVHQEVGVRAAKIFKEQNEIDFTPVKRLSKGGWEETYRNATSGGAVVTTKKKSVLSKALEKFDKCKASVSKGRTYAEKYKAAKKLDSIVPEVHQAISKVQEARGYTDQKTMSDYLLWLRDEIEEACEKDPFEPVLSGRDAPFKPVKFEWTNKGKDGWQDVKKKADTAGLIKKSHNKTGIGGAIDKIKKLEKNIVDAKSNQKRGALTIELAITLTTLRSTLAKLQSDTKNENFINYLRKMDEKAEAILKECEAKKPEFGGKGVSFEAPFVWDNKGKGGWQEVKKAASKADLFILKAKTGFGSALDETKDLFEKVDKAMLTKDKKQKLDQGIETFDLILEIAKKLKDGTDNDGFRDYFSKAINEVKTMKSQAYERLKNLN